MVTHPIHVRRDNYRGRDERKRNKTAETNAAAMALESLINGLLQQQEAPVQIYYYQEIASMSGYAEELVRRLCFAIDGGSTGFTAIRKGLTQEQAFNEMHSTADKTT